MVRIEEEFMSAKQIAALLNSHIDKDDEQFFSIALQAAAQEARAGRQDEAERLKRLVQKARDKARAGGVGIVATPIPLARPRSELQGLVHSAYPKVQLDNMVLSADVRARLDTVVREQRERAVLRDHGQTPSTHLLLVGPPGTGKTMTASALAGELKLPLFSVRLEAVFSKLFGETAGKLRVLFDQIAQTRGVYLLDEFDAIGASRSEANDVGEVRRVLNSMLAFMEEPNASDSLVVAATNHAEILDSALARRFDDVVAYDVPDAAGAKAVVQRRLGKFKLSAKVWAATGDLADGLSQAELVRAADTVVKRLILDGATAVTADRLTAALGDRRAFKGRFRSST